MDVSVIIPAHNAESYIEETFDSILSQELQIFLRNQDEKLAQKSYRLNVQVSIFDDSSTDGTPAIIEAWRPKFEDAGFSIKVTRNESDSPSGVGFAKNRAVVQSSGTYLCFCDADDIMQPRRIKEQYLAALEFPESLIGSKFTKLPEGSTHIFSKWANNMSQEQLQTQIFQSFGPTIVMPTWFCHRRVFDKVPGGFSEEGRGTPEDLIFFYEHLRRGGGVHRVDENLMIYRYLSTSATFSVKESIIWSLRLKEFEDRVLSKWDRFTIWGGGKLGRKLFRSLTPENQRKVVQFVDVDVKKVNQHYEPYPNPLKLKIPIRSLIEATSPFVVCIKTEYTWDPDGPFQTTTKLKGFLEGVDFYLFS